MIVLVVQAVIGLTLIALVATDNLPFTDGEADGAARRAPVAMVDRFDGSAAWDLLVEQVEMGPRPAGSEASKQLATRLRPSAFGASAEIEISRGRLDGTRLLLRLPRWVDAPPVGIGAELALRGFSFTMLVGVVTGERLT